MGLLRFLRIMLGLGSFIFFAAVAHGYHSSQQGAVLGTGVESKFIGSSGQVDRMGQPQPSMIETARTFVNGLLGREEKPKSGLAALRQRQAFSAKSPEQRKADATDAEIAFWTSFVSKLGIKGP